MLRSPPVTVVPLECFIQPYAWGSRSVLAELTGRASPSERPEAELWIGAHARLPARCADSSESLLELIARAPSRTLGAHVVERFGARLPFLLKVLAVSQPLSLQAHPDSHQARLGFAREESLGVPVDADTRCYRDPFHKPELVVALTPFSALCGFREPARSASLLQRLAVPELAADVATFVATPGSASLRSLFERWMRLAQAEVEPRVGALLRRCGQLAEDPREPEKAALRWLLRLGQQYATDRGVLGAVLLELVELTPGEALFLGARQLHAYLDGVGVELMAASDNVLRGGLTAKHVDVEELLRVLSFERTGSPRLAPRVLGKELVYAPPVQELRLARLTLGTEPVRLRAWGPELLFCASGTVTVRLAGANAAPMELQPGRAAFVEAATESFSVAGPADLFRATLSER